MANSFCIEKSKPSKIKRLSFLPRLGFTVDLGGRQIVYRQAPLIETLVNLFDRGFSMKNLMDISLQQLKEIEIPEQLDLSCENKNAVVPKKKVTKKVPKAPGEL